VAAVHPNSAEPVGQSNQFWKRREEKKILRNAELLKGIMAVLMT